MSSGRRDVVFFGSLSVSVIGHTVRNGKLVAALKERAIVLRTSAVAASDRVEEVFGAVAVSAPLAMASLATVSAAQASAASVTPVRKSRSGQVSGGGTAAPSGNDAEGHTDDGFRLQRASFLPLLVSLAKDVAAEDESQRAPLGEEANKASALSSDDDASVEANVYVELQALPDEGVADTQSCPTSSPRLLAGRTLSIPSVNQHAAADTCAIVRVEVPTSALRAALDLSGSGSAAEDEVAMTLYVMVRVVDLSQQPRILLEADAALRRFLALPVPTPSVVMRGALTTPAPYGVMPLTELYTHYQRFWRFATGKALTTNDEVVGMLAGTADLEENAAVRAANESYPHRWNALRKVVLDRVLLGDHGFAPLVLTLAHCPSLATLVADRNALGDLSCGRICALLASHRCLTAVSVVGNRIYEGGADQLLRLARRNLRVAFVDVTGNPCSPGIVARIKRVTTANWTAFTGDLLNVFTDRYAHITTPTAISRDTTKIALSVWAVLIAAPVGDVDVWVRNSTTQLLDMYTDDRTVPRIKAMTELSHVYTSVPAVARAPLLNEVQRTVYVGISRAVPDPLVRSVFTDVDRVQELNRKARDEALNEAGRPGRRSSSLLNSPVDAPVMEDHGKLPSELAQALHLPQAARVLPEDELYSLSFLRIVVVTMRAVAHELPWDSVAKALVAIGKQQKELGVTLEDYVLATHVFVKSLYVTCGEDNITSEWAGAFLTVLALGLRTAVGSCVSQEV